nr:protein mono-ADP-ribosyltransferase PARP9 [Misgurnus anguillicaudatus]XP_055070787.1 protein mono-ADP-ribosyltransferase PARP9 [Misgurnus anguillicaudatus]XP_055070789.1 protein mono-ADP-ribosyltransferase PARP9 [Misgurnus anguillicaudatus]XP_055070790.1 protein mono-ADP-ribosyltransferase PARP9 [Misgurnus anguillicaudatus]XP_055070791.1 protein mono-ADP-ribosyltransferase PARP9 [Misgurnus anguillicaudatus]XP_055070792.1 protein mono-ADP-ribosyltransferase PARP9 [Misgurnus anguillicaudatus]
MNDKALIPLTAENSSILRKCRSAYCKAVETKFDCTAILHNLDDSDSFGGNASNAVLAAELRYYTKLPGGVKVSVWKDDLTRHKVDAVVNAANEHLNHGGGLALALSVAGGPMIQHYSDQIIKAKGIVPAGTAVVGDSGNLPCKRIIHAVGPCLSPNPSQREVDNAVPVLRDTIRNILHTVEREKFSSVAIPALSSGLFHFPRNLCADIIVKTIKQYDEFNAFGGRTVEINLVNNDEPTVKEMERACMQMLGMPTITGSYSGAVKGGNQSMPSSSGNSLQLGNITLHLKKGYIEEEQKVDVIVNTVGDNLDLSGGLISGAILEKAGRKIQDEIYGKKKMHIAKGDVFETKGYKLNCAQVYHAVCVHRSLHGSTQVLSKVVFDCLREAAFEYKSIAFPAIGTGNLGFDKQNVAKIMMDAVSAFATQNPRKSLDINFVVFPKDGEMMQAFEKRLEHMKERFKSSDLPNAMMKSSAFDTKAPTRNETPSLEISGVSKEAVREAKAWTINMLMPRHGTITVTNNFVIYLGQKDHETLRSLQTMFGVYIAVFFRNGHGGISITGESTSVSCAALEVESMLCQAQKDFAKDEESELLYSVVRWQCKDVVLPSEISAVLEKAYLARNKEIELHECNIKVNLKDMFSIDNFGNKSSVERRRLFMNYNPINLPNNSFYARTPVDSKDYFEMERKAKASGLNIIRVEKIENTALQQIFELNSKRVKDKPKTLYQCVSAQFCDLICRVGFQKDFAPPAEQKYGSGIYFSSKLDSALKLWRNGLKEEYIYIIQAQVLTGKWAAGSPDFILPPVIGRDPLDRYDSVTDLSDTHVIFSGQQALPEYLIICDKSSPV